MSRRPKPTQQFIHSVMNLIDWQGHVEIGDSDKHWLAGELAAALSGGSEAACEVCGFIKPIVLTTALGRICEDCIDSMADEVEGVREQMEGGDDED